MPFGYFGAKHGMAPYYPPPEWDTIVEPFAGAAGYACHWSDVVDYVVLRDIDANVIALWHRLQAMTVDDLFAIPMPVKGERTVDPLIASASGEQGMAVLAGKSRQVTDRMVASWPRIRDRIAAVLPYLATWDIAVGHASSAPDIEATWFIDPPYAPRLLEGHVAPGIHRGTGGARYAEHRGAESQVRDYAALGEWCTSRRGQVIVCEQSPADWLPFEPFRQQRNGVGAGTGAVRTEVMWYRP